MEHPNHNETPKPLWNTPTTMEHPTHYGAPWQCNTLTRVQLCVQKVTAEMEEKGISQHSVSNVNNIAISPDKSGWSEDHQNWGLSPAIVTYNGRPYTTSWRGGDAESSFLSLPPPPPPFYCGCWAVVNSPPRADWNIGFCWRVLLQK